MLMVISSSSPSSSKGSRGHCPAGKRDFPAPVCLVYSSFFLYIFNSTQHSVVSLKGQIKKKEKKKERKRWKGGNQLTYKRGGHRSYASVEMGLEAAAAAAAAAVSLHWSPWKKRKEKDLNVPRPKLWMNQKLRARREERKGNNKWSPGCCFVSFNII